MLFDGTTVSSNKATPITNIYVYGDKTQTQTLTDWYGYCTTALSKVDADSVYARRIQVESLFPEFVYLAYNSSYKGSLTSYGSVTATFPSTKLACASYQEFYEKAIGLGFEKPSEFHTYAGNNGGRDDSMMDVYKYRSVWYAIYENMWRNWGITVS